MTAELRTRYGLTRAIPVLVMVLVVAGCRGGDDAGSTALGDDGASATAPTLGDSTPVAGPGGPANAFIAAVEPFGDGVVAAGFIESASEEEDRLPVTWSATDASGWIELPLAGIASTADGECGVPERVFTDLLADEDQLLGVTYGGIDSCDSSRPILYTSSDGANWTQLPTTGLDGDTSEIYAVAEREGRFVAGGQQAEESTGENAAIWVSDGAEEWERVEVPGGSTDASEGIYGVATTTDGFVAMGSRDDEASSSLVAWRSADGLSWEPLELSGFPATADQQLQPSSIAAAGDGLLALVVAYTDAGLQSSVWVSADGADWSDSGVALPAGAVALDVAVSGDEALIVGGDQGLPAVWSVTIQ